MIRLAEYLKTLLYPRRCMLCRRFLQDNETDLCYYCRTAVEDYPFGAACPPPQRKFSLHFLDSFTAVWYYEGSVRKAVIRYKFHRQLYLASAFGRLLGMRLLQMGPYDFDILTWVPVSRLRKLRRGYDQCECLAKAVGKELGIEPIPTLKKIRHNPPQSGQTDAAHRRANVQGVYRLYPGADVRGKVIVLLDDVYTTGATANECARVLLTAGAKEIHCAVIASAARGDKYINHF